MNNSSQKTSIQANLPSFTNRSHYSLTSMKRRQSNQLADDLLAVTSGATIGTISGAILGLTGAGILVPAVGSMIGGAVGLMVMRQQRKKTTLSLKKRTSIDPKDKAKMTGSKKIRHTSRTIPYGFHLSDPS